MRFASFFILFFLLILPNVLNASDEYIQVTTTQDQTRVWDVRKKLDFAGYEMIFNQTKTNYILYSGPFADNETAKEALFYIKQHFPGAFIISQLDKEILLKTLPVVVEDNTTKEIVIKEQDRGATIETDLEPIYKNGFFIGASIGYGMLTTEQIPLTGNTQANLPSSQALSSSIKLGYSFANGMFVSLNQLKSGTLNLKAKRDLSLTNIYGSINYRYARYENFSPYIGMLAGTSDLNWVTLPDNATVKLNKHSFSRFVGYQIGIMVNRYHEVATYFAYQYMIMDHTTNVSTSTGTAELQHNRLHNIQTGIQISF